MLFPPPLQKTQIQQWQNYSISRELLTSFVTKVLFMISNVFYLYFFLIYIIATHVRWHDYGRYFMSFDSHYSFNLVNNEPLGQVTSTYNHTQLQSILSTYVLIQEVSPSLNLYLVYLMLYVVQRYRLLFKVIDFEINLMN